MTSKAADLTVVHLSDIHFREDDGKFTDRNADLRREIAYDLRLQQRAVERYDAIVISGDIAFSGQADEFKIAREWLYSLCQEIGCPQENILPVPGNHDVDRNVASAHVRLKQLRSKLRTCPTAEINDHLKTAIENGDGAHFLAHIAAYNDFAAQWNCQIDGERHFWERDFQLSHGVRLRFRGMNSICVSDENDSDQQDETRLLLGCFQTELPRQPDLEYVVLAHHPPDWLRDQAEADKYLNNRARLQLFGHKHDQVVGNAGNGLRIVSGAAHPSRREPNWEPRYNVLRFRVLPDPTKLEVRLRPRRWSKGQTTFIAEPKNDKIEWDYTFALDDFAAAPPPSAPPVLGPLRRRLLHDFRRLGPDLQLLVARDLGLARAGEFEDADAGFAEEILRRAGAQNLLAELHMRVSLSSGQKDWQPNPFELAQGAS